MSTLSSVNIIDDILLDPSFHEANPRMNFYLTYEGPLPSYTTRDTQVGAKETIRRQLSPQLKDLWTRKPLLIADTSRFQEGKIKGRKVITPIANDTPVHPARRFFYVSLSGWRFIPLVIRNNGWIADIKIQLLHRSDPGEIFRHTGGDLDNRLKTLFDALRMPLHKNEVASSPQNNQDTTCFCLLEDDSLITSCSIVTGRLLGPPTEESSKANVQVTLHVTVQGTDRSLLLI